MLYAPDHPLSRDTDTVWTFPGKDTTERDAIPGRLTTQSPQGEASPSAGALLLGLQRQALSYFLDNQLASGLVLDRQRNRGRRWTQGVLSSAATGMGFIALALASAEPYRLLPRDEAVRRVRAGIETALNRVAHDHGMLPHFVSSRTGRAFGMDVCSTVDTAWLLAGALWAGAFLGDEGLEALAHRLYDRADWRYWSAPSGLLHHGKGRRGKVLSCTWDRFNGETVFMYVLAAGAREQAAVRPDCLCSLRTFHGEVMGLRFNSADLGLFVFQYGLDLLDVERWRAPLPADLAAEARLATLANRRVCQALAGRYVTYRTFWGLSAGDGPGVGGRGYAYRCYAPGHADGTAHLTATLASVAHDPAAVLDNLHRAVHYRRGLARGRYGFGSVNVGHNWVASDMVGIDAGAAALALDNYLMGGRVRAVFHRLACVRRGLERLGFTPVGVRARA